MSCGKLIFSEFYGHNDIIKLIFISPTNDYSPIDLGSGSYISRIASHKCRSVCGNLSLTDVDEKDQTFRRRLMRCSNFSDVVIEGSTMKELDFEKQLSLFRSYALVVREISEVFKCIADGVSVNKSIELTRHKIRILHENKVGSSSQFDLGLCSK
jgi:hypothetical protein